MPVRRVEISGMINKPTTAPLSGDSDLRIALTDSDGFLINTGSLSASPLMPSTPGNIDNVTVTRNNTSLVDQSVILIVSFITANKLVKGSTIILSLPINEIM